VGSPERTGLGTYWLSAFTSKARGSVGLPMVQYPHELPEHEPIQSVQSGSCSAASTSVPPLTAFPPSSPLELLLLSPQAAAISPRHTRTPTSTRLRRVARTVRTSFSPPEVP